MGKTINKEPKNLITKVLELLPPDAEVVRIEFEGPRLALYTKNPLAFLSNNYLISDIVKTLKKRIIIKVDEKQRKEENKAKTMLYKKIPNKAEVLNLVFDGALGEVIIEVRNPHLLTPENGFDVNRIIDEIGWRVKIRKASPIPSQSLQQVYYTLKATEEQRTSFLRSVGERIFRERILEKNEVRITALGGFKEVGRSAILIETLESKVLVDCGLNPGAKGPLEMYPRLDLADLSLDDLDAVIISHAHLDHTGFIPVLFKYGYEGPVYCTEPTLPLTTLLLTDAIKVASMEGGQHMYDMNDVRAFISHCITLPYGLVTDITTDVKLVLNNAGHILGSATVHLHIGEGAYNIVYTGDYKFDRSRLFPPATFNYPRVEALITESTYGAKSDIMPPREETEKLFIHSINEVIKEGGKVLIPVPAVGRAQEILLVLNEFIRRRELLETTIFIEGMIKEATAIHLSFPEYLTKELRTKIMDNDENPFLTEYFTIIEHPDHREEAKAPGPAIIIATSGMLEGGPSVQYFMDLAEDKKNKILFVSYQVPGTLGRRVLNGAKQVSLLNEDGKIKVVNVNCKVEKVEGFSGHSDYNQIIKFVAKFRNKAHRVIVNHGERKKVENVAIAVHRILGIPTLHPSIGDSIKLL
jgi:hypothetical protein